MHAYRDSGGPVLRIDPTKIEDNARLLCDRLAPVAVTAVTKVTCAAPEVGRAMLAGGATALADSRLANLRRLREAGVEAPLWLLRAPAPEQAAETVRLADVSLDSELVTLKELDAAAAAAGREHGIVLMVDLGDLREGVLPDDLLPLVGETLAVRHLRLEGVGVNLTCYGGVMPTPENLGRLVALAAEAAGAVGRPLVVSGGNSSSIPLALAGRLPEGITNLRVGESILLGVDTIERKPLEGLHRDAFTVWAPVIECKVKPSLPVGEIARDAFGNRPSFVDRGLRRRAICALGRQDAPPEGLRPLDRRVGVLGASSDHLILDVHDVDPAPSVGDTMGFIPSYAALLQAFTSPYVHKVFTPPA